MELSENMWTEVEIVPRVNSASLSCSSRESTNCTYIMIYVHNIWYCVAKRKKCIFKISITSQFFWVCFKPYHIFLRTIQNQHHRVKLEVQFECGLHLDDLLGLHHSSCHHCVTYEGITAQIHTIFTISMKPCRSATVIVRICIQTSTSKLLLLAGPAEPCESLFDKESEEAAVVDGGAGGGTASDFSDRFSLKVRRTTVMSDWLRISCVGKRKLM